MMMMIISIVVVVIIVVDGFAVELDSGGQTRGFDHKAI